MSEKNAHVKELDNEKIDFFIKVRKCKRLKK